MSMSTETITAFAPVSTETIIESPAAEVVATEIEQAESVPAMFNNPADWFVPPFPKCVKDLDVSSNFLTDLALKAVSLEADPTSTNVAARLHLPMMTAEELLQHLYREKYIEMKGVIGLHNHRYAVLERGWSELGRLMSFCSYVGPAPVSLKSYSETITQQVRCRPPVKKKTIEQALTGLVLPDEAYEILGLVATSARSLFLNGSSGNGKTATARALVNAIPGDIWIPYAIEVDGQVIRVFDSHNHQPVKHTNEDYDKRWVRIRAPLVVVGGELTIQSLDLMNTDSQRFYEAPFQMKANGGVLVVDDLGRQRCSATELLNRWIIPLENRIDYLTLNTGKKFQVPFEQIVVFATNLTETDLEDEAFMRRMGYRLHFSAPTPDAYMEIFTGYARTRGLAAEPRLVTRLMERYLSEGRIPKCCDPRDLIDRCIELCKLRGQPIRLSADGLDVIWKGYFGTIGQTR